MIVITEELSVNCRTVELSNLFLILYILMVLSNIIVSVVVPILIIKMHTCSSQELFDNSDISDGLITCSVHN